MFPFVLLTLAFLAIQKATSKRRITGVRIGPVHIGGSIMPSLSQLVTGVDWKKAKKLTMKYGPAVARYYPPAALAMGAMKGLQKKAQAGDPVALAKMTVLAKQAQAGNPAATGAVKALSTLSVMRDRKQALAQQEQGADYEEIDASDEE